MGIDDPKKKKPEVAWKNPKPPQKPDDTFTFTDEPLDFKDIPPEKNPASDTPLDDIKKKHEDE